MKGKIIHAVLLSVLVFAFVFAGCSNAVKNENSGEDLFNPDDPYVFEDDGIDLEADPVADTFTSVAETAIVPDEVEARMSTEGLFATYMVYPGMYILSTEDDPEAAYEEWAGEDNSLAHQLADRDDCVEYILEEYKKDVQNEQTEHLEDDDDIMLEYDIDWLEMFLAQKSVYELATEEQRTEISELARLRDENVFSNGYAITDYLTDLANVYGV